MQSRIRGRGEKRDKGGEILMLSYVGKEGSFRVRRLVNEDHNLKIGEC